MYLVVMKTLITTLVALVLFASCSKHIDQNPAAQTQVYFSRVQYFKDGRQPSTDTVWTLHLTTQTLIDTYSAENGQIYADTRTYTDKGVMWQK
jgi:hypothetical protein